MYINGKKLKIKRYSSGELRFLKSDLNKHIKQNKVTIIYDGSENFFELMLVVNYFKNFNTQNGINPQPIEINLVLSYLPYQRMDHTGKDELNTLYNVADLVNMLNVNSVLICEPHSKIDNFKNAKSFSYIKHLKEFVFKEINNNDVQVVLTDKGSLSRYNSIFGNAVYFNKARDANTGLIIKHEIVGDIKQKENFLIVDDIISTGDTIVNIVNYLNSSGAKNIYILCGHFEKNKYNKRLFNLPNVKKIFSTNSLTKRQNSKLKLYDVKEILNGK